MGERGRPKKPAAQHKLQGTFQPSRHAGPALKIEVPNMPPDMQPLAQAAWKNITSKLFAAGLVSDLDQLSLRLLSESVWLYHEAQDLIIEKGLVIATIKGNLIQNPAIGVRNKAWAQIVKLASYFGMTPSARTGLQCGSAGEDEDGIADILNFKVG
jgi:P27 family predicted phage terminase small subunit